MDDPENLAEPDDLAALEHSVHLLEHETGKVGMRAVRKLGVPLAAMLVLALAVWIAGRRLHGRGR